MPVPPEIDKACSTLDDINELAEYVYDVAFEPAGPRAEVKTKKAKKASEFRSPRFGDQDLVRSLRDVQWHLAQAHGALSDVDNVRGWLPGTTQQGWYPPDSKAAIEWSEFFYVTLKLMSKLLALADHEQAGDKALDKHLAYALEQIDAAYMAFHKDLRVLPSVADPRANPTRPCQCAGPEVDCPRGMKVPPGEGRFHPACRSDKSKKAKKKRAAEAAQSGD